jgi:hypothetical protein
MHEPSPHPGTDGAFEGLLDDLTRCSGMDLRGYERAGLMRRVRERMVTLRIPDFDHYRAYLAERPDEADRLLDTVMINVTGLFRDPAAWQALASEVIPSIAQQARSAVYGSKALAEIPPPLLERELRALRSTVRELETTREELEVTNAAPAARNDELHAANAGLEAVNGRPRRRGRGGSRPRPATEVPL